MKVAAIKGLSLVVNGASLLGAALLVSGCESSQSQSSGVRAIPTSPHS